MKRVQFGLKTGILKGKGLSLGVEPPPADSLDSSASDENVDAQSRLSYKLSDGCCQCRAAQSGCGLEVPLMWRTHKSILTPSIQTERLHWNLQDLCDSVLLPWPVW